MTSEALQEIWERLGGAKHRPDYSFDKDFYSSFYADISSAKIDPLWHYEKFGRREGRIATHYRLALANLNGKLPLNISDLVIDAGLRRALDEKLPGAEEVAYELIRLGDPIDRRISNFSSRHYMGIYRDIDASKINPFSHYIFHGVVENRVTLGKLRENILQGKKPYDPNKPTCLICTHEFSRSGAPAVALDIAREASKTYNVIVMSLKGGRMMDAFLDTAYRVAVVPSPLNDWDYLGIQGLEDIEFAVLNSVETAPFIGCLVAQDIPFVSYIHEYSDYILPAYKAAFASLYADTVLFSSNIVQASWKGLLSDVNFDISEHSGVVAQANMTFLPSDRPACREARLRLSDTIGVDCGTRRIVYGAGHMQIRKGTDLFILMAQQVHKTDPDTLFVWIGDGANHEDIAFGVWLDKHMRAARANTVEGNLFFIPSGPYYEDVCTAADVLFLPSRLDPLPNVVFDAARHGCTTVLFREATGFDDPSYDNLPHLQRVDYGDLFAARKAITKAPKKLSWHRQWTSHGSGGSPVVEAVPLFEMIRSKIRSREREPAAPLPAPSENGVSILFRNEDPVVTATARQNERALLARLGRRAIWPDIETARETLAAEGGWMHAHSSIEQHSDIPLDDRRLSQLPPLHVHIHAHYLDNLKKDLSNYALYRQATQIVATTDTEAKATQIEKIGAACGVEIDARVVANQGRDILPFLQLVADEICDDDAIWCHVHQKKSITSTSGGDVWRAFLMRILLGDEASVASAVERIAEPGTGLVTAFDPYIVGWVGSRRLLPDAERRLGRSLPSAPLLFPVGNMFWTRARVARGMLDLFGSNYAWPNEPLPNDGTVYHLIERLWPAVAAKLEMKSVFVDRPDTKRI